MSPEEPEEILPEHFLPPNRIPLDAQRMGADRWSAPGLMFASQLNRTRPRHRFVAWVMLIGLVAATLMGAMSGLRLLL